MSASDSQDNVAISESVATPVYVQAPPSVGYQKSPSAIPYSQQSNVYQAIRQQVPIYRQPAQYGPQYIDVQPEFTQSWADFYQPPGYLPLAFKNVYIPNQPQQYQNNQYNKQPYQPQHAGSQYNPHNIGFGYITWSGPINPASFYQPIQPAYYYKHPPMSPFFTPAQYSGYKQPQQQQPQIGYQQAAPVLPYKGN